MQDSGSLRQLLITVGLVILLIVVVTALVDMGAVFDLLRQADWGCCWPA